MEASRSFGRGQVRDTGGNGWLSPLNRRRLANFKANRRGFWALWIFLVLFVLSLGAEFLANDRPLLIYFKLTARAEKAKEERRSDGAAI